MKKLLTLIGINILMTTNIIPVIEILKSNMMSNQAIFLKIQDNSQKQINTEITISHNKHNNDDEVIVGTKDYKEEFAKSIHKTRTKLIKANADNIKISNITTKFKFLNPGQNSLPAETFIDLLTAKNIEIISTKVTIKKASPELYSYAANYTAIIDGKKVTRNINGYEPRQLYLNYHVLSPYTIKFDIDYEKGKFNLQDALKNFKFSDEKEVKEFLDINNQEHISKQITKYLRIKDLSEEKLTLQNQTSNSIELIAASDSPKYKGKITLTWNLKLFEIYGVKSSKANNQWIRKGLKGYFYLQAKTNQIKYFDVVGYLSNSTGRMNPAITNYHKFTFKNQNNQEKNFTFDGKKWTNSIAESFKSFDFTKETRILIQSPEINKIKVFNLKDNTWEGLTKTTEFLINNLGQIKKVL